MNPQSQSQKSGTAAQQHVGRFVVFPRPLLSQVAGDVESPEPTMTAPTAVHEWTKQSCATRALPHPALAQSHSNVIERSREEPAIIESLPSGVGRTSVGRMTKSKHRQSILERYTQSIPLSASCQGVQKHCLFPDCTKMSVSKGLCRGHGGGRRCHFDGGCTKSAQSGSMFCWAHGGGQRCDVANCMRSRKSKRFCVAHLHLDNEASGSDSSASSQHTSSGKNTYGSEGRHSRPVSSPIRSRNSLRRSLPSLDQALTAALLSRPNLPALQHTQTTR